MKFSRAFTLGLLAITFPVVLSLTGHGQEKAVRFVLPPQDSLLGAGGLAIGSIVADSTQYKVQVSHVPGPQQAVPLLSRGDRSFHFTIANQQDAYQAFSGTRPHYDAPYTNLRLVAIVGQHSGNAVAVLASSAIHSASDIRGKRVTGVFAAHQTCRDVGTAQLANLGLGWNDVRVVPVSHSRDVPGAVAMGIAEVGLCVALDQAAFLDVDIRAPMRVINADPSPEALARARQFFPGIRLVSYKQGSLPGPGQRQDLLLLGYDFYLLSATHVPEADVYAVLKAIWENRRSLKQRQQWMKLEVAHDPTIPYHAGAVRFFKEVGLWTAELDAKQQEFGG